MHGVYCSPEEVYDGNEVGISAGVFQYWADLYFFLKFNHAKDEEWPYIREQLITVLYLLKYNLGERDYWRGRTRRLVVEWQKGFKKAHNKRRR